MIHKLLNRRIVAYLAAALGIAVVTAICEPFAAQLNNATVALAMLLVVLFVADIWGSWPAIVAAALAGLAFEYYFLPPLHSFAIASVQDRLALAAFFVTALTVGELSARASRRTAKAEAGRKDAQSESAYHRGLIEASLDALFTIDRDGKITDLNAAAEAITGRSRAEILGTDFSGYFTDPAKARAGYERAFREGFVRDYQLEVRCADGTTIPVLYNASVYRDPAGEVAGVFAAARDVSALTEAEREIRRLASFPQLAPVPIIEFDRELRVRFMNPAMQQVLGTVGQILPQSKQAGPAGEGNVGDPRLFVPARWAWELSQQDGPEADATDHQEIQLDDRTFEEWVFFSREFQSLRIWASDITPRKQSERALARMNHTLRTLTSANQTLVRATSEQELLQKMCRVLIDVGGYRMAWIGLAENDEAKTVRAAAVAGHDDGYVEQAHVSWADNQRGRGPTGTAIRTRKPQVNRSFATDPRMAPWRAEALKRGYASSVALPLIAKAGAFGALTIYAADQDAFDPDEVELFIELAGDLAYGISALRAAGERETAVRH